MTRGSDIVSSDTGRDKPSPRVGLFVTCLVDLIRQRQLYEDAVRLVVRVQLREELYEVLLARLRRKADVVRADAHLDGSLVLPRDVDVGGGIVADEHSGKTETAEPLDLGRNLCANLGRKRSTVHHRRHGATR